MTRIEPVIVAESPARARRLRQAAPSLLAACKLALLYIEDGACHTAADRLRAAIAAATGEQP